MYKVIKETINSNGNVVFTEFFANIETISDDIIISLTKLANVINTEYVLDGLDVKCRFKIIKESVFDNDSIKLYIKDQIIGKVKLINTAIKHKNNSAIISAKRANKEKVQLIKEVLLEDYLYPIIQVRVTDVVGGVLVE